jgi:hypothetical protein
MIGDVDLFSNVEFKWREHGEYSSQESNAAKVGIPLTEKIYFFICIGLIKIYILFMKPNQPYDEMYMLWDDLLVSIMFKLYQWCLRDSARVKSIE